jgi:hypothetical protein
LYTHTPSVAWGLGVLWQWTWPCLWGFSLELSVQVMVIFNYIKDWVLNWSESLWSISCWLLWGSWERYMPKEQWWRV